MAHNALAKTYFDELQEANTRIFDLRSTVADLSGRLQPLGSDFGSDALRNSTEHAQADVDDVERKHALEKSEWQEENAALRRQMSSVEKARDEALIRQAGMQEDAETAKEVEAELRSQLEKATTRQEKQEARMKTLTQQLTAEQREVARLHAILKASGKIEDDDAGLMEVRDEQRLKREGEDVEPVAPTPKRRRHYELTFVERQLSATGGPDSQGGNYQLKFDETDFVFKVILDGSNPQSPTFCTEPDLPLAVQDGVMDMVVHWQSRYGLGWREKFRPAASEAFKDKVYCVQSKLHEKGSGWRAGYQGVFACRACVKNGWVCFRGKDSEFWMLPLHPEDRVKQLSENEVAAERWLPDRGGGERA